MQLPIRAPPFPSLNLLAQPLTTLPYMVAIKRQLCGQKLPTLPWTRVVSAAASAPVPLPWANVNFIILCKRQKSKGHKEATDTARQEQLNGNFQTRPDESRLLAAIALPCNPAPALVTFVLSPSYERIANLNSSIIDQTRLSPHAAWRIANERSLVPPLMDVRAGAAGSDNKWGKCWKTYCRQGIGKGERYNDNYRVGLETRVVKPLSIVSISINNRRRL